MNETQARARLMRMAAPTMDPVLSPDDITDLLTQARVVDVEGLLPSDVSYVATWTNASVEAAAAAAWEVKAGRAAADFRFSDDGQSFSREQVHQQCLNMSRLYRRGAGSARVSADVVDNLVARPVVILGGG